MSEYVARLIRRDLARPTMAEWLQERRSDDTPPRHIDVVQALDEARVELDPDERHAPAPSRPDRASTGR